MAHVTRVGGKRDAYNGLVVEPKMNGWIAWKTSVVKTLISKRNPVTISDVTAEI